MILSSVSKQQLMRWLLNVLRMIVEHGGSTCTGESDFRDVCRELVTIKAMYYQLGVELGLSPGELDAIRKENSHDADQSFNVVVLKWLRQQYEVERFGCPTWKRLVEAVESPVGGNNPVLAAQMAVRHRGIFFACSYNVFGLINSLCYVVWGRLVYEGFALSSKLNSSFKDPSLTSLLRISPTLLSSCSPVDL